MAKSSYIASTICISLLLLLLGVVGYFMIGAKKAAGELASGVKISLFLEDDTSTDDRAEIERLIKADRDILAFAYITSEEATANFEKNTGITVDTTYGTNPIPASYELTPVSLEAAPGIQARASEWIGVDETYYPSEVGTELARKVQFVGQIGLYAIALLLFLTLSLIYYTLKLSILSSAEAIRTMQLVGARNSFIKRPYIKRSVIQGFVAAVAASGLLILVLELFARAMEIPKEYGAEYWKEIAMIGSALCVIGVTICTLFTIIVLGIIVKTRQK